jgi:nicotinamide-nucleotide amidase
MLFEYDELAFDIGEMLVARGEKLAVSETTAGGLIAARLLSVTGASRWFERGIIPYSGADKFEAMGIDRATAGANGAVSREWVIATAEGLQRMTGAAWTVSESGIAGPQTNRRSAKPAGTVVMAVAGPGVTQVADGLYPGTRVEVMQHIAQATLEFVRECIKSAG